ncbi:TonB-dependent receptor plug domain-containing protein [Marinicella sediminis]|uniref:TonB-dependent receptor plug domain-containing protein n=1 Tax=Marinicella sediminis TaxID=1792834 RepID=A0ABV7JEL7_9GAMM|nr:TonB-dependent receptor [Marinicella sediminis]
MKSLTIVAAIVIQAASFTTLAQQSDSSAQRLPKLIVSAGITPIETNQYGGSATVFTREDIDAMQVTYLSDLLRQAPGFAINQSGGPGTQTQLRVRGSEANHVLVLLNGVRVNDPTAGDEFLFNYALLDHVERIEIIRGPQSAIWGTDAMSAVINIITREAESTNLGLDVELGSFNSKRLALSGDINQQDWQFSAGINALDSAGTNVSRTGPEADGFENLTGHASLSRSWNSAIDLALSWHHSDATNEFDGTDFVVTGLPTDADLWTERTQDTLRFQLGFTLFHDWTGELAWHRNDIDADNFTHGTGVTSATASTTDEFKVSTQGTFGQQNQYSLAVVLDHREIDFTQRGQASPFGDPNQDQQYHVTGLGAEFRHQFNDQFSWQLSARQDDFNRFDDVSNAQLAGSYLISPDWRVRAAIATGSKAPSFIERFGFFPANFIGNPDLQPEQSTAYELGFIRSFTGSSLEVVYFNQDLEDEIDGFVFDPASGLFTAANRANDSQREGLELIWSGQWQDHWQYTFNYTYTDASETDANGSTLEEVRRPEHQASASVFYRFAGNRGMLGTQVNHVGDQLDVFFDPATFVSSNLKLDAYTTVDLTLNWDFNATWRGYIKAQNVFDERYEEVLGYARPGASIAAGFNAEF